MKCAMIESVSNLVTSRVAADRIGVGLSTLQAWAAQGIVKPAWRTPGGQARWDVADLRQQLGMPEEDNPGEA